MGAQDYQVPRDEELAARLSIERMVNYLPVAETQLEQILAAPNGLLARENRQTAYDPIETQVHHLVTAAWEPLDTSGRLLVDGLPMLSLYPLIRASIEASAYGIWLLSPGTSHKRVMRSLRLTKKRREDAEQATRVFRPANEERDRRFRDRLEQLKNTNKKLQQSSLDIDFPSTTDILIDSSRFVVAEPIGPLDAWRICSGFAHANDHLAHRLLERRQLTEYEGGVAQFHLTSSFSLIERVLRPAVASLSELLDRFQSHSLKP